MRERVATIEFIAIEPSEYVIAGLKEKLLKIDGVSHEVKNKKFALEKLKPATFDCITFFHAAYYLATEEVEFEELYRRTWEALKPGGVLLVQAVNENGDFQALGHPSYSIWAQGEHTLDLLKRISPEACRQDFPTRFDVSDFLEPKEWTPELGDRFLNLYRFTTQVDSAMPSHDEREKYLAHMRSLAKEHGNGLCLDFSDIVVSVHKPLKMKEHDGKWIGITGTWRRTNDDVETDVRAAIREVIARGDGVVVGGALGVDYFALDEALRVNLDGARTKVTLPSSLENYIAHLEMWADGHETGDPAITYEEAGRLIKQLRGLDKNSLVENTPIDADKINREVYFERNSKIVELSDEIIAFQVNGSAGTQDTIDKARSAGKNVVVHSYSIAE